MISHLSDTLKKFCFQLKSITHENNITIPFFFYKTLYLFCASLYSMCSPPQNMAADTQNEIDDVKYEIDDVLTM